MRSLDGFEDHWKATADHVFASAQPMAPVTDSLRANCAQFCCSDDPRRMIDG